MSGCTDTVGVQVLGNLTVIGLGMLLDSCSLARFRQSVPLSVDFSWLYCQDFAVCLTDS